jgi:hypothetical protein
MREFFWKRDQKAKTDPKNFEPGAAKVQERPPKILVTQSLERGGGAGVPLGEGPGFTSQIVHRDVGVKALDIVSNGAVKQSIIYKKDLLQGFKMKIKKKPIKIR